MMLKKNTARRRFGVHVLGALLLTFFLAVGPVMRGSLDPVVRAVAAENDDELDELSALEQVYQAAADKVAPSVVRVWVQAKEAPARGGRQGRRGAPGIPQLGGGDPAYNQRPDLPSAGVIIDANGIVATSASFVAPERLEVESIEVGLPDGRRLPAKLLGRDENIDVALLKVEAKGLPAAQVGDSEGLVPGRFVVTVARSEGRYPHVTAGIISAIRRHKGDAIQLDALVNYGSAGAAVVDLDGNLVGIVSRVVPGARSGQSSGVGFAAPIHLLAQVRGDLVAGKVIERRRGPFLGVSANQQQSPDIKGVELGGVIEGTAAATAGLKAGDIITIFNGVELESFQQLAEEIGRLKPGDEIILTAKRGDWEKDFTIKLGARPDGQ